MLSLEIEIRKKNLSKAKLYPSMWISIIKFTLVHSLIEFYFPHILKGSESLNLVLFVLKHLSK